MAIVEGHITSVDAEPSSETVSLFDFDLLWTMVDAQRNAFGINAKTAAEQSNVDESKLSRKGSINIENIARLCEWLNLPVDTFIRRSLSAEAQERFDELVSLYASPDEIRRRIGSRIASAHSA